MNSLFQDITLWVESSKYILLFIGTLFEGPVIMLASGFLFKLGQFNLVPMYFALILGDFVADIGWYCVGRFGTRTALFKYGRFVGITPETLQKVENRFKKFHQKILIISKLTMGLGFAAVVLVVAGIFKVPFKNYVILNLIGGFIWTALLVCIGYFFGNVYNMIPEPAKILFILIVLIAVVFGLKRANAYLAKQEL